MGLKDALGRSHAEGSRLCVEGADLRLKWQVATSKGYLAEVCLCKAQGELKAVTVTLVKERLASKLAMDELRLDFARSRVTSDDLRRARSQQLPGGKCGRSQTASGNGYAVSHRSQDASTGVIRGARPGWDMSVNTCPRARWLLRDQARPRTREAQSSAEDWAPRVRG